jgi:hypothetical protein
VKQERNNAPSFSALSSPAAAAAPAARAGPSVADRKRALAAAAGDADDSDDEDAPPAAKKARAAPSSAGGSGSGNGGASGGAVKATADGGVSVSIGDSRRVEVRTFKRMVLIDIRETYTDKTSGEERPGKKGISLRPEQWEKLMQHRDAITAAVNKLK